MDLQPIKEALGNAAPGPWVTDGQEFDETYSGSLYLYSPAANEPVLSTSLEMENAILIANAPTWLAQLVAEVERLRGIITDRCECTDADRTWGRRCHACSQAQPTGQEVR